MKVLFVLLFGLASVSYAQKSRTLYFDAEGKVTAQAAAHFYSIITPQKKDTTLYVVESFFKTGILMKKGAYKAQRFPVRWELCHEFSFTDALPEGMHQEFYQTGKLQFEGTFTNGLGQGKHRRFYDSGQLLSEISLTNGREEGKSTTYFENGKRQTEYATKNGSLDGDYIEYQTDGKKKNRTTFRSGEQKEFFRYDGEEKELPKP